MADVKKRTSVEVGQLVKARRVALRLTQDGIDGVSSATVRKIESGQSEDRRPSTVVALTDALGWPHDALERLAAGEDPATFTVVGISAHSGIDVLDELSPDELAEVIRYADFVRSRRSE